MYLEPACTGESSNSLFMFGYPTLTIRISASAIHMGVYSPLPEDHDPLFIATQLHQPII
jgi:hypothetical protein